MGCISKKLADRLRNSRSYFQQVTEHASEIAGSIRIPKDVKNIKECVDQGFDPVHEAYISAQNLLSSFAECVSVLDEFEPYYDVIGAAQEEYMPSGPPMSPLTGSYFTTWAFLDLRFGPDRETIGTCLLDVSDILGLDDGMIGILRRFQASRMGIYVHDGTRPNSKCVLRELATERAFICHVSSGYKGRKGELWYVRLCPPLFDLVEYHVVFTTPYVLLDASEADWTAYLNRSLLDARDSGASGDLHSLLKFGKSVNGWNEFVFQAFHHSQACAIFLAGVPDVKGSLPHAT